MLKTVYDRIQSMSKDELQKIICSIYLWGHIDEQCHNDDTLFYQQFLDAPAYCADTVVSALTTLEPVVVYEIPLDGGEPHYWDTKFLSSDDAYYDIKSLCPNIVTVDDVTYATPTTVYKLEACSFGTLL